jgi:hypothetical protein
MPFAAKAVFRNFKASLCDWLCFFNDERGTKIRQKLLKTF